MHSPLARKAMDASRPRPLPSPSTLVFCPRGPSLSRGRRRGRHSANEGQDCTVKDIRIPSERYHVQKDFLIVLNARFRCTSLLAYHKDSKHTVGICRPNETATYVTLQEFIDAIGSKSALDTRPNDIEKIEERFFEVLRFLHDKELHYPVWSATIQIYLPLQNGPNNPARPELFLPLHPRLRRAKNKHTWKARQIAEGRSIFRNAKILLRLSHSSSRPLALDPESQRAIGPYVLRGIQEDALDLCANVAPMIPEFAHRVIDRLWQFHKSHKARGVFEAFFGGPVPLPEPGTPPVDIHHFFVRLRARACHAHAGRGEDGTSRFDQDLEDQLQIRSSGTLWRLISCRAKVAAFLGEEDEKRWRHMKQSIYDARFLLRKTGVWIGDEDICVLKE